MEHIRDRIWHAVTEIQKEIPVSDGDRKDRLQQIVDQLLMDRCPRCADIE